MQEKNGNKPARVPLIIYMDKNIVNRIGNLTKDFPNATINDIVNICIRAILPKLEGKNRYLLTRIKKKEFKSNGSKNN